MARTTPNKVRDILGDHYDSTKSLKPFIDTASTLVDYVNSEDSDGIHSTNSLKTLESWLAAHFYGHMDQFHQTEGVGGASATYQGQTAMVFNSTQYGQTALALDFTGTLAKLQKQAEEGKKEVGFVWLGTRYKDDDSERASDQ